MAFDASIGRRQAGALRTTGDHFGNLTSNHPLIWRMAESFGRAGKDRERFEVVPGGKLDRLMSVHGDGEVPPVEVTVMEVAAAATIEALELEAPKSALSTPLACFRENSRRP